MSVSAPENPLQSESVGFLLSLFEANAKQSQSVHERVFDNFERDQQEAAKAFLDLRQAVEKTLVWAERNFLDHEPNFRRLAEAFDDGSLQALRSRRVLDRAGEDRL